MDMTSQKILEHIHKAFDKEYARCVAIYEATRPKEGLRQECSVPGCTRVHQARGFCKAHHAQWQKGHDLDAPQRQSIANGKCLECDKIIGRNGGYLRCPKHYRIFRRELLRQAVHEMFGMKCHRCAVELPPRIYDFHHVDPTQKDVEVSLAFRAKSIDVLAKELSKCIMVCPTCHRVIHDEIRRSTN